jgi:hypothetical protein
VKTRTPPSAGAGSDLVAATTSLPDLPKPDNGNSIVGYGSARYRRARDLGIAGGLVAKWNPTPHELEIVVSSWRSPRRTRALDDQLFQLLTQRTAPSRECADPRWFRALSRESDVVLIISARLRGYVPEELLEGASKAAAAVTFGATVSIHRLPAEIVNAAQVDAVAKLLRDEIAGQHEE